MKKIINNNNSKSAILPPPPPPPHDQNPTSSQPKSKVHRHKEVHINEDPKAYKNKSNNVTDKVLTNRLESEPSMDINESAEAFIKKFREQLAIQRLESIEKYEKMLEK